MSDYLDNLIAKSLGLAEVVTPRPTSLFEPLISEAGPIVHEYYSSDQEVAPRRTPASAAPVTGVAAPPASKDGQSEEASAAPRAAQSDRQSQLSVEPPVQSTDLGVNRPAAPLTPDPPVAVEAGQRVGRARSETPPTQQPGDQRPSDQQMGDSHQAAPVGASSLIVSQATIPAGPQGPGAPEAEPFAPAQASGAPVTPSSPSGGKLVAPVSLRRADQESVSASHDRAAIPTPAADAAAPTIKITIGRVDVRAVTPDKESPRHAPPARNQALTLEEYLKRRSGGKI
jgi:hypothetical protein